MMKKLLLVSNIDIIVNLFSHQFVDVENGRQIEFIQYNEVFLLRMYMVHYFNLLKIP